MKFKKMTKKNKIYFGCLLFLILILVLYLLRYSIMMEINEYKNYDDYSRAGYVLLASFNKDLSIQWEVIQTHQKYTKDERITAGDLIYDFSQFGYVPILNYLNIKAENEELKEAFEIFGNFLTDFHSTQFKNKEDIIYHYENGSLFEKVNDKYIYTVNKEYISKESFNKLYQEYLNQVSDGNLENYFIENIYKKLNKKISIEELTYEIKKNYDNFYNNNEDVIISVISEDLTSFSNYLINEYIRILYDENDNYIGKELIKEIETKEMSIEYAFVRLDRIYNSASKYYVYSYKLDLNYLWEQLNELNLPKLYC